ncbi:dTMP kinase [Sneathiella glossodoripedis]|uniref:dTMP kinase n=1 Tax=Sneathiella glossodoripedis TaxID=418853 RepID=UPI00046F43EE|nr:dTMP kinase [Sneathiella glossodoripedis]
MSKDTGKFITLEGGDGSGKSTQSRELAEFIKASGREVLLTREPGGAAGADEIRKLLLTGDPDRWDGAEETLLFYTARLNHLRLTVKPALAKGIWVISDRFADSTMAYQGYGNRLGPENVQKIHDVTVGSFEPDLTCILDLDVYEGLKRTHGRSHDEDRFERMDIEFHERMRKGFQAIAKENSHRCVLLDASGEPGVIQRELRRTVQDRLMS